MVELTSGLASNQVLERVEVVTVMNVYDFVQLGGFENPLFYVASIGIPFICTR